MKHICLKKCKLKKIKIGFHNLIFELSVKKLKGLEKGIGLMFSLRKRAKALLFEFNNPQKINLHSLFVFFPFLVLWLDKENNVLDFKMAKPFRFNISSTKPYSKIIEIPLNSKYRNLIKILVERKGLKRIYSI